MQGPNSEYSPVGATDSALSAWYPDSMTWLESKKNDAYVHLIKISREKHFAGAGIQTCDPQTCVLLLAEICNNHFAPIISQ